MTGGVPLALWRLVHTPLVPAAGGGPGSRVAGPVVVAACACSKTGFMPHVLPHQSTVGVRFVWLRCACDFAGPTSWATPGCCRKGTWCVPTRWRACIWPGVTRTRGRVVPPRSRVLVLPVGPPPTSLCRIATGPVSLHGWFVWMTCCWWGSRSCKWFHMLAPTLVGRPRL